MNEQFRRDSIYDIEPWNEEPSRIPKQFLTSQNFAKTSSKHLNHSKYHPQLEIASNSVYYIQHHQGEGLSNHKLTNKFHQTANNSPKFRPIESNKRYNYNQKESQANGASRSTSSFLKKRGKNPEEHTPFQHTKKIVFESKPSLQKGGNKRAGSASKIVNKDEFQKNLLRIYERSTLANDQKKLVTIEKEEIDEICRRRKMKT